ncbi:hypothetical protein ACHAWX_005018 [Stephanocyclus meneghinianus]
MDLFPFNERKQALITSNDPRLDELYLNRIDEENIIDLGVVGHYIRQNTSIKCLTPCLFDDRRYDFDATTKDWGVFFSEVSSNQTINEICFDRCYLEGHILKLLDIRNLEKICYRICIITSQLVSALQRDLHFRHIEIRYSLQSPTTQLTQEFIAALNHNHRLEELVLCETDVLDYGYRALNDILLDQRSILKKLHIDKGQSLTDRINDCDDEEIQLLRDGLMNNTSLTELGLTGVVFTDKGWKVVSEVLMSPVTALRCLDLFWIELNDECAQVLASGLAHNATLDDVKFTSLSSITAVGWLALVSSLNNPKLQLRVIGLNCNNAINDEVAFLLANVLARCKQTMEELHLSRCLAITDVGWMAISVAFRSPMSNFNTLSIGNERFNDDVAVSFANCLCDFSSLKALKLRDARFTNVGWGAIARILQSNQSGLQELILGGCYVDEIGNIDDEVASILADGLVGNTKLHVLYLGHEHSITDVGWDMFSTVLCNTSSINATYDSNHTLCEISAFRASMVGLGIDFTSLPASVSDMLELNKGGKVSEVARLKILQNHFIAKDISIESVIDESPELQMKLAPHLLHWLGRDHCRQTPLYNFIRNEVSLFKMRGCS